MTITTEEIYLLNKMNSVANRTQLGTLIYNAENVTAGEIALTDTYLLVGNGSNVAAGVALSGDATISNLGVITIGTLASKTLTSPTINTAIDINCRLDCEASIAAGASPGHLIKGTATAGDTFTGTYAGLIVKQYDADNTVVHTESELCGLYVNLKQLSAVGGGGKSALISAHNYGSGGDYQVLDFGLRLFGDIVDAIEITGGTVTSAIKLDTCSALTNVLKLADGVGCTLGSDGMTKDPESGAEDGFITIDVGGTGYQIPIYTA